MVLTTVLIDEQQVIKKAAFLQQFNLSDSDVTPPEQREKVNDLLCREVLERESFSPELLT